jgi:ubiquinone/menaquinone biosynthesis C-methylase UbiE
MKWNNIYSKKGEVQKRPLKFVGFLYKYLNKGKELKILDLGCGTGRHTFYLAKNKNWKITSIDLSPTAINFIKEKSIKKGFNNISVQEGNFEKIPFDNKTFDVILSTKALHHGSYDEIEGYCKEIYRVLKPGGYLVLSILSDKDFRVKTGKPFKGDINTRIYCYNLPDDDLPHHFFTDEEIKDCFEKYKFVYKKIKRRIAMIGLKPSTYYDLILQK